MTLTFIVRNIGVLPHVHLVDFYDMFDTWLNIRSGIIISYSVILECKRKMEKAKNSFFDRYCSTQLLKCLKILLMLPLTWLDANSSWKMLDHMFFADFVYSKILSFITFLSEWKSNTITLQIIFKDLEITFSEFFLEKWNVFYFFIRNHYIWYLKAIK